MLTGRPPESRYDHRVWSADFTPTGNQDRATSVGEPYRELIKRGLGRGRNAMAILQDSVSDHGLPHGYQTVKRVVRNRGSESLQAVAAGGPSCLRNKEHHAKNQPENHDLNYGRPWENAATAM